MIRALLDYFGVGTPSTAEAWAARAMSMRFTPADRLKLDAWLAQDPKHREEYARYVRVSQIGAGMRERLDLVGTMRVYSGLTADHRAASKPKVSIRRHWLISSGAAVAATAVVLIAFVPRFGTEPSATVVATRHGEQRELPLPDGTRVYLNTDSALQVAFSDRERRVRLSRGEGFFDVTRDALRPFVVEAGHTEVRVVGTRFSVRSTEMGTDVIVSEGKVEVVPDVRAQTPAAPAKVELVPGNALRFDHRENFVMIAAVDPERATSWRTGSIRFENATLEEVIAEVNRYASTPFVIADESRIKEIRLTGTFKIGDVESVRFVLKDGYGLEAIKQDGRIAIR